MNPSAKNAKHWGAGTCLAALFLLLRISVYAQTKLEDYPCLSNRADKYHVVLVSEFVNDTSFAKILRNYARCIDTTCADMQSSEEIELLVAGLENDRYDWACNLALYELYQREAGYLLVLKPRPWRKHYRDDEIAYWRERIKQPLPTLAPDQPTQHR
jgi:hypothetical protein